MSNYNKITALYSRLSVGDEDRDGGESNSIQNQKIFLENYAKGQHLTNIRHYIDDDESGRLCRSTRTGTRYCSTGQKSRTGSICVKRSTA